jgi:hypothetical protein
VWSLQCIERILFWCVWFYGVQLTDQWGKWNFGPPILNRSYRIRYAVILLYLWMPVFSNHFSSTFLWTYAACYSLHIKSGLEGRTIALEVKASVRNAIAWGFSSVYLAYHKVHPLKLYTLKHVIYNDSEAVDLVMKEIQVMNILSKLYALFHCYCLASALDQSITSADIHNHLSSLVPREKVINYIMSISDIELYPKLYYVHLRNCNVPYKYASSAIFLYFPRKAD